MSFAPPTGMMAPSKRSGARRALPYADPHADPRGSMPNQRAAQNLLMWTGRELLGLLSSTVRAWWALAPWILGLSLFAWIGYFSAILVASNVSLRWPYAVIAALAVGVVMQLGMMILAMRRTMTWIEAQMPTVPLFEEETPTTWRILEKTILPFLCIYVAFGMVEDFAHDLLIVVAGRGSPEATGSLLQALNPATSWQKALIIIAVIVGLYAIRHVVDAVAERIHKQWLGLLAAYLEACFALLLMLSGFRLFEQLQFWFTDRQFWSWWQTFLDWCTRIFHIDVPEFISQAWTFFSGSVWPTLWGMLVQPLAWLALAALVAGSRLTTIDELWNSSSLTPDHENRTVRAIRFNLQETLLGDVDDKVLPIFHALRHVWKAGLPFLGAYIVAFTTISWCGASIDLAVSQFVESASTQQVLVALPFLGLVPKVLTFSAQVALLGVAFQRAGELAQHPQPLASNAKAILQGLTIIAVCVALAIGQTLWTTAASANTSYGSIGRTVDVLGMDVTLRNPLVGDSIDPVDSTKPEKTNLVFFVVTMTAYAPGNVAPLQIELTTHGHTYRTFTGTNNIAMVSGFEVTQDLLFEIDPDDITHPMTISIKAVPTIFIVAHQADIIIDYDDSILSSARGTELHPDLLPHRRVP